ncbi:MAG: response regulator [Myxococcota bacterium]
MTAATVLVVEDEALIAADLADALEHMGYQVLDTVGTVTGAREALNRQVPDLVLLDINLRGQEDGIDLAIGMRAHGTQTPIVFLTAHGDDRTLDRAEAVEPSGYLLKPFDERTLHATVRMALFRGEAEKARRVQKDMLAAAADRIQRIVLGIDNHGIVRLVNEPARSCGAALEQTLQEALTAAGAAHLSELVPQAMQDSGAPTEGFALIRTSQGYVVLVGDPPSDAQLCLCAWCRKAKGESGEWSALETVLLQIHNVATTHGICEACADSHFATFSD